MMMRQTIAVLCGLVLGVGATSVEGAALERAAPSSRVLFEPGRYAEFSLSYVDPDQRGSGVDLAPLGGPGLLPDATGDLFSSHTNLGLAYKGVAGDRLSYALILDQPFGADTTYRQGFYAGTRAELDTRQVTAILAFDATPAVKLYGGLRAQRMEAEAAIPFVGPTAGLPGYTIRTDTDDGFGWLAGAAYQRPEIALRAALTYWSEIEHRFDTTEFGGLGIPGVIDGDTRTDVTTPRSANLEVQTGIAPDTLAFGSVRWVDWSAFAIAPPAYALATGRALVDYEKDWWTYTLGLGRRFNDTWSGALSVAYEPKTDSQLTTLGPYDGRLTGTGALTYSRAALEVTGGLTYGRLGDTSNLLATDFEDGRVFGAGLRLGLRF